MSCEERSGFLFAHACDRPALWPCARCGKQICAEHTRLSGEGNLCITCVRAEQQETQAERERQRDADAAGTGAAAGTADPYLDSDTDTYDADDYSVFDASGDDEGGAGDEGDLAGS